MFFTCHADKPALKSISKAKQKAARWVLARGRAVPSGHTREEAVMKHRTSLGLSLAAVAAIAYGSTASAQETLELMHFWTSGGESNAMQVIKDGVQKAGIAWQDAAVAGGAGMNAYQVLQARIAAGNPPAG